MKAALWHKAEEIRVEDLPEPSPRPEQIKVKVKRVGICDMVEKGFLELIHHKDRHVKILIDPQA